MATQPEIDAVNWEDEEAIKKLSALFSSRIFVKAIGGNVRVHFGEILGDEPIYHTALVVSAHDAVIFGDLMSRIGMATLHALNAAANQPEMLEL